MKKDLNLQGLIRETEQDIRRPLDQMASDLDNAVKYTPPRTASYSSQSADLAKIQEQKKLSEAEVKDPEIIAVKEDKTSESPEIKPKSQT